MVAWIWIPLQCMVQVKHCQCLFLFGFPPRAQPTGCYISSQDPFLYTAVFWKHRLSSGWVQSLDPSGPQRTPTWPSAFWLRSRFCSLTFVLDSASALDSESPLPFALCKPTSLSVSLCLLRCPYGPVFLWCIVISLRTLIVWIEDRFFSLGPADTLIHDSAVTNIFNYKMIKNKPNCEHRMKLSFTGL